VGERGACGKLPADGVVDIYDLGRGDYLVNDDRGRTVNSLSLPDSKHRLPDYTTSNLINAGKTIGNILEERLQSLEDAGKGGKEYSKEAADRFFSDMSDLKKNQFVVWFK
jgi:hypothetical protein